MRLRPCLLSCVLAAYVAPAIAQSWDILNAARDIVGAATVSEKEIVGAARRAVQQKDGGLRIAGEGSPHAARLQSVAAAHTGEDGLALNFRAYQSSTPLAFGTADGSIRVTTGIMDLLDDDELRALIGHQIGHIKLGHALGAMRAAYVGSAARKLAAGAAGAQGYGARMASQELGQVLEETLRSRFSQAQEQAADDYAVAFLQRHHYRAAALETAGRKLERHGGRHGASEEHPDPAAVRRGRQRYDGM